MKFQITRTSLWRDEKPCEQAVKGKYTYVDMRSASKPEDIPVYKNNPAKWYRDGTNHRVINGRIVRDLEIEGWTIEISTLEDLLKLKEELGELTISGTGGNLEIKILDSYRE